jgi:hypothetical protein
VEVAARDHLEQVRAGETEPRLTQNGLNRAVTNFSWKRRFLRTSRRPPAEKGKSRAVRGLGEEPGIASGRRGRIWAIAIARWDVDETESARVDRRRRTRSVSVSPRDECDRPGVGAGATSKSGRKVSWHPPVLSPAPSGGTPSGLPHPARLRSAEHEAERERPLSPPGGTGQRSSLARLRQGGCPPAVSNYLCDVERQGAR